MGVVAETNILTQAKKGQGETNERLDRIAALLEQAVREQQRMNYLLDRLGQVVSGQASAQGG